MCPECHGLDYDVVELSGRGTVYSYAVLHHPRSPRFTYPLVTALVDLDEGVRLVTNLVGVEPADVMDRDAGPGDVRADGPGEWPSRCS